jgi:hypothetical protein
MHQGIPDRARRRVTAGTNPTLTLRGATVMTAGRALAGDRAISEGTVTSAGVDADADADVDGMAPIR